MRLDKIPEFFFVCRGCHFVHHDQYNIDKCPICKEDDWVAFCRYEENEQDEEFYEDFIEEYKE